MSNRLRNNVIAGFIVMAFWIIFVFPVMADPIVTQSTSTSTVTTTTDTDTRIRTNPPSAISPSINTSNSDICAMGWSGSVQTQILGISTGRTYRDLNCERLKIASKLYDMGMKVAAVAVMCQDWRTFDAMKKAGTPCPIGGLIGDDAAEEIDTGIAVDTAAPHITPQYTGPNKHWMEVVSLSGGTYGTSLVVMEV